MRVETITISQANKMFFNNWRRRDDIIGLMMWLYGLSRIFGNWPFSIEFQSKRELSRARVSFVDWLLFFLALLCYGICIWLGIVNNLNKFILHSFELVLSQVVQVGYMISVPLSIALDMINRNTLWNIVVQFYQFDEEVSVVR